jgi:hypothetical protein
MESGGMSGDPEHRHQIEFSDEVAQFFDHDARANEVIQMRFAGQPPLNRPLTYRGTDYGQWQDMWRLGLPTRNMGAPQYAGRVIKLQKVASNGGVVYEIEVADVGSPQHQNWQNQSAYTGVTGGPAGRNYGYW